MRWVVLALVLVALGGAVALGSGSGEGPRLPKVAFRVRVLPNGLKVISVVDRSQANVSVQLWYGVGGRDDPQGRSGFAHLIEHLMFRGSKDLPPDYISRLTEDAGGEDNASTDSDFTEYDDLAPAERLPQLLWAEARRMSSLTVDEAGFRAERAVVEQELQQEVMSDPYGPLFEFAIPRAGFPTGTYAHSPIGSTADLEAATLKEALAFHARYYRPDNATLVVVGDFDEARLGTWVDRYFGSLKRPVAPLPHRPPSPARGAAAQVVDADGENAPGPAVVLCYAAPRAGGRDAAALKVMNALLTKSGSARLYTANLRDRRLTSDVFSDVDLRQGAGMLDIGAMLAPGRRLGDGEAALTAVISDLRDRTATPAELASAKNQLKAQLLEDRESIDGLANQIGYAAVVEGDPGHVNADLKALQAVTSADVRRVADLYLADRRRVLLRYHPISSQPPPWAPTPADPQPPARLTAAAEHPASAPAASPPPTGLPNLAPPPPASAPAAPVEHILPNGLRVVVARTGKLPLATVVIRFRGGSALDPAGKAGLTSMIASLSSQGAGERKPAAVAAAIAGLGDSYSTQVDEDSTTLRLSGLANLGQALPILADIVRRPSFEPRAFQRARSHAEDQAKEAGEDLDALTDIAVARLVYGAGPYGHSPDGDAASLARITLKDLTLQHALIWRPDNAVLVVTGDVDPEEVFGLVDRAFGDWPRPTAPLTRPAPPAPAERGRVVLVDAPDVTEATVVVAGRSVRRSDGAYYAVEVANSVLGGGFSSRLNQEVRVRKGLSYDVSSEIEPRDGGGLFSATAETDASSAPMVARLMLAELKSLASEPPAADELRARQSALIGDAVSAGRTGSDLADGLADAVLFGRGLDDLSQYVSGVSAVTSTEVSAAASRLCDPNTVNILVIGDKKRVLREMHRLFGRFENISVDQLSSGRFRFH
jgi:zinc protease